MATLTTKVTISSDDLFGSASGRASINFTQTKDITMTPETTGMGTIVAPVSGGTAVIVNADVFASQGHMWMKNNGAVSVDIYRDSGSNKIAQLPAGGVMLAPFYATSTSQIHIRSNSAGTTASVDYFYADLT